MDDYVSHLLPLKSSVKASNWGLHPLGMDQRANHWAILTVLQNIVLNE